jgi:hypothetical protein
MVKTRNGSSSINNTAPPPKAVSSHPRARPKAKATDDKESQEPPRWSTRLDPSRSDSEHVDETLDEGDDNTRGGDGGHTAKRKTTRIPDRPLQTTKGRGKPKVNNPTGSNDLESAAAASSFATVTKCGPLRGLPKDMAANHIPGQGTMSSMPSSTTPLISSVSNHPM